MQRLIIIKEKLRIIFYGHKGSKDSIIKQAFRYSIVGLINTITSFSIIYILTFAQVEYRVANFCAYGTGMLISFFLHRSFTFRKPRSKFTIGLLQFALFSCGTAISYSCNFLTLFSLVELIKLPELLSPYLSRELALVLANIISMIVYTIASYFVNKYFVFRKDL